MIDPDELEATIDSFDWEDCEWERAVFREAVAEIRRLQAENAALVEIARRAAVDPRLNPSPCREPRCQCLACEARWLVDAIGGDS